MPISPQESRPIDSVPRGYARQLSGIPGLRTRLLRLGLLLERLLWGRSIRWQLIGSVAIVHALLMTMFMVGLVHRQREFLNAKARQRVDFQTRLLATSARHALITSDLAALAEVLANLSQDDPMRYAIITDPEGRVLADSQAGKTGLFLTDARSRNVLHGPTMPRIISQTDGLIAAAAPIVVNGQNRGWAWLARDISDDRGYLEYVIMGGLAYTLAAAAIGTLFAILLARTILRPLKLLLAGADRFTQGRLDEPIALITENEVGTVTRAFNAAMARLAEQRDTLILEVAQRTRAQHEADESNRAKDHFLAVLSHELRTPLTPVLTLAQMLERDPSLPAEAHEDIITIRRNVELEARLIDDLLDLTRISRGKIELRFAQVDVHEKIRQVAQMCREDAMAKHLQLRMDLTAVRPSICADPTRLQQVLWNVLKNAVKFSLTEGEVTVHTRNQPHDPEPGINADPNGEDLIVEIRDNGIGIEPEVLPSVFDTFQQGGREVTRIFGGLGLGLTISKALIDLHKGEITARSDGKGKGAVFSIRLPVNIAQPPATPGVHHPHAHPPAHRRILLVEDHADTLMATARLLSECGYEVRTANSVAAAVQLTRTEPFDLIVSDIGLPDGTGTELIHRLISEAPAQGVHLKGIAISGFGQEADVRRSKEAGFMEHLVKPFDPQQLIDAVDDALEEHSAK